MPRGTRHDGHPHRSVLSVIRKRRPQPHGMDSHMRLCDLTPGTHAVIDGIEDTQALDPVAERLRALGFVRGEDIQVIALGPVHGDPMAVRVGHTRFALRRAEAARVMLSNGLAAPPPVMNGAEGAACSL